jgi:cytoskeletal protein RodZ
MNNNTVTAAVIGIIIIVIGFLIYGAMKDEPETTTPPTTQTTSPSSASSAEIEARLKQEAADKAAKDAAAAKAKEVAFSIDVTKLPEAQQVSLKTMGMNDTKIEVTNAMVTCAEADISGSRVAEIKGGASVTASEGIKLVSCYNAN